MELKGDRPPLNGSNGNGKRLPASSGKQTAADQIAAIERTQNENHQQNKAGVDRLAENAKANAVDLKRHVDRRMQEVDEVYDSTFQYVSDRITTTLNRFAVDASYSLDSVAAIESVSEVAIAN